MHAGLRRQHAAAGSKAGKCRDIKTSDLNQLPTLKKSSGHSLRFYVKSSPVMLAHEKGCLESFVLQIK